MFEFFKNVVIGRKSEWNRPTGHSEPTNTGENDAGDGGFTDFTAKAASRIVAIITQKFEYVVHQPIPADGRILASAEVATENEDGSLTVATCQTRVVTTSGAVVAPHQLASKCGLAHCGQYESELLRCFVCGIACCLRHCRELSVGGEERICCEEHLKELLKEWDVWAEHDVARGITRLNSGAPSQPVAVKSRQPKLSWHDYVPQRQTKQAGPRFGESADD